MKRVKRICSAVLSLFLAFSFTACSGSGGGFYGGGDYYKGDIAEGEMEGVENGENTESQVVQKPAGLMTAGAWNDNDNYDFWKTLFEQNGEGTGKFFSYFGERSWGFNSYNRIKVTVQNGENPVAGAKVVCKNQAGEVVFKAVSDAVGVAYVFTDELTGVVEATSGSFSANADFTAENRDLTLSLTDSEPKQDVIELSFVVDVTGSMGDEISFLQNELVDVISRVSTTNPQTQINLSMLFYRDYTDKEVFKYYDFVDVTTSEGLASQVSAIKTQLANGGGDYPEAVSDALERAVNQQWSSNTTTKIIFHVLDAPPHSNDTNRTKFYSAVKQAAEKGIRICPIICSGAAELTEYLMRQAAIYTGGTFVFVTDDSGIGNPHHDPDLPNVTVEALNSLMVRLINGYHIGEFAPPVNWRDEVKE